MQMAITTRRVGAISIVKYTCDWEHLDPALQMQELAAETWNRILNTLEDDGFWYDNPKFSVHAPPGTDLDKFLRQARAHQKLWLQHVAQVFGSSGSKRLARGTPQPQRELIFTGVLRIDDRRYDPRGWPDVRAPRCEAD